MSPSSLLLHLTTITTTIFFFIFLVLSPTSILSSPLSTVGVSFVYNQTVVCALVITDAVAGQDSDDHYTLNCTSFPSQQTLNYPSRAAYYSAITTGDGFLCGASNQSPSSNVSFMRWWDLSGVTSNTTDVGKRIYRGPPLVKLNAGEAHACGIIGDEGRIMCWRTPDFVPPKFSNVSDIAVGGRFYCAVLRFGDIKCFGYDTSVVGNEPAGKYSIVAAGSHHVCALSITGVLDCWGSGAPVLQATVQIGYSSVVVGSNRTCALRADNTAACWGPGFLLPAKLSKLEFSMIEAKGKVFCGVVRGNFSLLCWGTEEFDSNSVVFDKVLPGPCVSSCGSYIEGSANLCPTGTAICEAKSATLLPVPPPPPAATAPPPSDTDDVPNGGGNGGHNRRKVFMIVGCVCLGTVMLVLGFFFLRYCKDKWRCQKIHDSGPLEVMPSPAGMTPELLPQAKNREQPQPRLDRMLSQLITRGHSPTVEEFPFHVLHAVTNGFSNDKKIGSGSFGSVYRAVLADGREVAIKRAEHDRCPYKENAFLAELAFLSRVNHRNLVRLLGFCQDEMELVLVYDYMANGTLHDHLHKLPASPISAWHTRIMVALDAARGIEYLHHYAVPAIIHRDIKSSNILLDDNWTAKVADFGLCQIGPDDDTSHLSLHAAGTVGYMDPEYYRTQCLTTKSDVYSFGVVLLELLTGCKAVHRDDEAQGSFRGEPRNVVDFAVPHIEKDEVQNVLDPRLPPPRPSEIEAVQQLGYIAADCVRLESKHRPDMSDVIYNLEIALDACSGPPLIRSETTHSV